MLHAFCPSPKYVIFTTISVINNIYGISVFQSVKLLAKSISNPIILNKEEALFERSLS